MTEEKTMTGYPSIDKPWLKYYDADLKNKPIPDCTIYEYIYENNKDTLDNYAINYFGTRISYKILFEKIDEAAVAFKNLGVKKGDIVTLVTIACVNQVICFYALNKIGAVSNFVNVLSNEEELKFYIEDGHLNIVVALDLFAEKVITASKNTCVNKIIVYSLKDYMPLATRTVFGFKTRKVAKTFENSSKIVWWKEFCDSASSQKICAIGQSKDLCFLGHTGGTTGFPKSVLLSNNSFNSVAWQYVHTFPHERTDVFLSVMVPFVTYGSIINIHMPLCLGLEVALIPKFDANDWAKYIKKYKVTHLSAIPAYVAPMAEDNALAKMDLSGLKTVGMGGEGMNVPLEEKINTFLEEHHSSAKILKGYGMTEVCATAAVEYATARKEGSVGIPFINNSFMIFDNKTKQELKYGEIGEICMQCLSVMDKYKDNPKATEELIKQHSDGTRWIHTGDLGYIDEDGFIFVEGRMKRMIMTINDGVVYKIFPSQTETILNSHAYVHESCVVGMKKGNDIGLKAFLVLENESDKDSLFMELDNLCKKDLADNQVPDKYEVLKDFPRTPAGKVDYRRLEEI